MSQLKNSQLMTHQTKKYLTELIYCKFVNEFEVLYYGKC